MSNKVKLPTMRAAVVFNRKPSDDPIDPPSHADPMSTEWRSVGIDEQHPLHGMGVGGADLIVVKFSERKLPGRVIDDHLKARIKQYEARDGRKYGRKEIAELKDEVVQELLPKSFVVHSHVLVSTHDSRTVIWCSQAKKVDTILTLLSSLDTTTPIETVPIGLLLNRVATDDPDPFEPGNAVVMYRSDGDDSPVIRIKDRAVGADEVQHALAQGYAVRELQMSHGAFEFTLTDQFVFKRLTTEPDDSADREDEFSQFEGDFTVASRSLLKVVDLLIDDEGL